MCIRDSPITVSAAVTVTGTYKIQYQLTFAQSGIGGDTGANTVVTVAGSPKAAGVLPFSDWFDAGSSVTYSYQATVDTSPASGKRYALTTPAPTPASPITVSAAVTVTGTYKIQYQLTFAQSGIGGDTGANTVVTVAGSPKAAGVLPFSDWFDAGSSVTYSYENTVNTSPASGKRYALTTPAPSPASPITVSAAATITGTYKIQYRLTFAQSGIGNDTGANTIVTVAGSPKAAGVLPFSDWFDA